MTRTKLYFVSALPGNQQLLEQAQAEFPEAQCKSSFNGFIDIRHKDVVSSLDISQREIIVTSKFEYLKPKYILMQVGAAVAIGFPITNWIDMEAGSLLFFITLLVPVWAVRLLLTSSATPKVKSMHEQVAAFLQKHYQGELAS